MADPISDVRGLFESFTGMAGGLKQLHDIRVQTQAARASATLDKLEHDYLSRFYLPHGDPNRLTADKKSWRPALADLESKTSELLAASSGDETIRAAVEGQLAPRKMRFQLDLQATMAQAELKLAQETTISTIKTRLDMGDHAGAYAAFDEAKAIGVLNPEMADAIDAELILPSRAQDEYQAAVSGSDGSLIKARNAFAGKEVASGALKARTMAIFNARIKANDDAMIDEIESTAKKALEAGYAKEASEYIKAITDKYQGNVSPEAVASVIGLTFDARKGEVAANMDSALGVIEASAGAVYEDGKLVSGTRKISAAEGFVILKEYESLFRGTASKNEKLAAQYETNVGKIRALIAEGKADEEDIFEANFNHLLTKYKTEQGVDGNRLMSELFKAAPYIRTDTFIRYMEKIEEGGFLPKEVQAALKDPELMKLAAQAVGDEWTFKGRDEKTILAFNKAVTTGDFSKVDAMALGAYQTALDVIKSEAAKGGYIDKAALQGQITLALRGYMDRYNAGAYEPVLEGASKGSLNKTLGQRLQSLPELEYDFYGNAYTDSVRQAVVKAAAPIAGDLVRAVDKSITDKQELVTIWGPDNAMYVIAKGKSDKLDSWRRTAYKIGGNSSGIIAEELTFTTTEHADLIRTIQESGDSRAKDRSKPYAAADILYRDDPAYKDARTPTERRMAAKDASEARSARGEYHGVVK